MVSLTDLWKAAGSPSNKKVGDWLRSDTTEDFIEAMSIILKCGKFHLLKVKPGKGGGTISHKNIADWLRSDTTEDFIETMSIILKRGKFHLLKVKFKYTLIVSHIHKKSARE